MSILLQVQQGGAIIDWGPDPDDQWAGWAALCILTMVVLLIVTLVREAWPGEKRLRRSSGRRGRHVDPRSVTAPRRQRVAHLDGVGLAEVSRPRVDRPAP